MAANTGERTLIPAIVPPGTAHIHRVSTIGSPNVTASDLAATLGAMCSLLVDFAVRVAPKSDILKSVVERLPFPENAKMRPAVVLRVLRLNCLTTAFAQFWKQAWSATFGGDSWTTSRNMSTELGMVGPDWTAQTPLRRAVERRQALLEIDALVAIALGISVDELVTIYSTQFPVLAGYDRDQYVYDARGRLVPTSVVAAWRKAGDATAADALTVEHPISGVSYEYLLPLVRLDREADLRAAYSEFEQRFSNSA